MKWSKAKQSPTLSYASATDRGRVRADNQDSFGEFLPRTDGPEGPRHYLFIVADGMGGHVGGQRASQLAVQTTSDVFFTHATGDLRQDVTHAIEAANGRIYAEAANGPLWGMGTTCTALAVRDGEACIGHVGDSRVYRIDEDGIEQITEDHTQVAALHRQGLLTAEEARTHPRRSILTRALGGDALVNVDTLDISPLEANTTYLLCSDGLAPVADHEIYKIAATHPPAEACARLIALANERGGPDNITVQIIQVGKPKRFPWSKNGH